MRTFIAGAQAGFHRRAELFINGIAVILALAGWVIFGAFVIEQRDDVLHDARTDVVNAQHILGSHIDTAYESAETLLKIADTWLKEASSRPIRPPLSDLIEYISELTESDERAITLLTVDPDGTERPFSAVVIQQPVSTASPRGLANDAGDDDDAISIELQRYDSFAGSVALPLSMPAGANAYGIKRLRALLPVRIGEGPFGMLMPRMPARTGVVRPDGEIVLSWPVGAAPIGQHAAALAGTAIDAAPEGSIFTQIDGFPGIGHAYVSYAKVDSAPLGVFAALSSGYVVAETRRRVEIPGLITVFGSIVILLGGFLITRAVRRSLIEAENTRKALNAAEAANEAKRQFLANMSHELRTPLNAIIGFAEVMQNQLFGPLGSPQYVSYSGDILGSGKHLLGLIQTILDMARFEAGKLPLGDAPTSLKAIVRETVRLLHERAADKKLDLHIEVAEAPLIRIDPLHLRQIVINLLSNAIKFSKSGGVIAIDSLTLPTGGVALRVTDTGIGIPAEAIDKLFLPFSQVDGAYSRKHDGVGLGLSICRSIMKAYGGSISLESQIDMGTMVTLTFPQSRLVAAEIGPMQRSRAAQ